MIDVDTFLTMLYVMIDDFCTASLPTESHPGPHAALSRSEVLTLAIFGQGQGVGSERGFYRYAQRYLRPAFPTLPTREQFNRHLRHHQPALVACVRPLGQLLAAQQYCYEALDSAGVPTRDAKRRGAGRLPGLADIGWSNRLGWYEGFHLLLAVNPVGVITGFGFGAASTKDQPLADTFFALRRYPQPEWQGAGTPAQGPYAVDKGFAGAAWHKVWQQHYGAVVSCPSIGNSKPLFTRAHLPVPSSISPAPIPRHWARLTVRDGERTRLRLLQWGGTKPRRLILRLRYPLARPVCGEGGSSCIMPVPPARPAAARMPHPSPWQRPARPQLLHQFLATRRCSLSQRLHQSRAQPIRSAYACARGLNQSHTFEPDL